MKIAGGFLLAALLPVCAGASEPQAMGVGPNGYDFLLGGKWTCTADASSAVGGPKLTTVAPTKLASGALRFAVSGAGFEAVGYLSWSDKSKSWNAPTAFADGSSEVQTSTSTGATTVFTGTYTDAASGKTSGVRDSYSLLGATHYTDIGESRGENGSWSKTYRTDCVKH